MKLLGGVGVGVGGGGGGGSDLGGLGGGGVSFWGGGNGGGAEVGGGFGGVQAFGLEEIQGGFGEKFQFVGGLGGVDGSGGIHLSSYREMKALAVKECKACLIEVVSFGEVSSGNVDIQGVQGCLNVNASGNGGEIGEKMELDVVRFFFLNFFIVKMSILPFWWAMLSVPSQHLMSCSESNLKFGLG